MLKYIPSWKRKDINEIYEEVGTYVGIKWDKEFSNELINWAKKNDIPNIINSDEIHSTLIYSRVGFEYTPDNNEYYFDLDNSVFHVFENPKLNHKALVIKSNSVQLINKHKEIMDNNPKAVYDFPEYIPHITISYDVEDYDISKLNIDEIKQFNNKPVGVEYKEELNLNKFKK